MTRARALGISALEHEAGMNTEDALNEFAGSRRLQA
jgi:hypothetical protein